MQVWVLLGTTESGDEIGPYVWQHRPLQSEIDAILATDWTEDFEAGTIAEQRVIQKTANP